MLTISIYFLYYQLLTSQNKNMKTLNTRLAIKKNSIISFNAKTPAQSVKNFSFLPTWAF